MPQIPYKVGIIYITIAASTRSLHFQEHKITEAETLNTYQVPELKPYICGKVTTLNCVTNTSKRCKSNCL